MASRKDPPRRDRIMLCTRYHSIGNDLTIDSRRSREFRFTIGDSMLLFMIYPRRIQAEKGMARSLHMRLFVWVGVLESRLSKSAIHAATKTSP
jgi:hypothetical protein